MANSRARHVILDRPWLPGFDGLGDEALPWVSSSSARPAVKTTNRPIAVMELVTTSPMASTMSGYLNPSIYSDSCFFDGPDSDMPCAASEEPPARFASIFCLRHHHSPRHPPTLPLGSDALRGSLTHRSHPSSSPYGAIDERSFIAHWRLSGSLKLPWRPAIKPYAGATRYELDENGLIASHTETWSISASMPSSRLCGLALALLLRPRWSSTSSSSLLRHACMYSAHRRVL